METCQGKLSSFCMGGTGLILAQNLAFAKDQTKFSIKKVQNKLTGGLSGREPDVETEI